MVKVNVGIETIQVQAESVTVATWKVPLRGSASFLLVIFPGPLNNNSALCLPGMNELNRYNVKWKQICGALCF